MVVIIGRNDEVRQLSVSAAERLAEIAQHRALQRSVNSSSNVTVSWPACATR
jgi:hypothetical protein